MSFFISCNVVFLSFRPSALAQSLLWQSASPQEKAYAATEEIFDAAFDHDQPGDPLRSVSIPSDLDGLASNDGLDDCFNSGTGCPQLELTKPDPPKEESSPRDDDDDENHEDYDVVDDSSSGSSSSGPPAAITPEGRAIQPLIELATIAGLIIAVAGGLLVYAGTPWALVPTAVNALALGVFSFLALVLSGPISDGLTQEVFPRALGITWGAMQTILSFGLWKPSLAQQAPEIKETDIVKRNIAVSWWLGYVSAKAAAITAFLGASGYLILPVVLPWLLTPAGLMVTGALAAGQASGLLYDIVRPILKAVTERRRENFKDKEESLRREEYFNQRDAARTQQLLDELKEMDIPQDQIQALVKKYDNLPQFQQPLNLPTNKVKALDVQMAQAQQVLSLREQFLQELEEIKKQRQEQIAWQRQELEDQQIKELVSWEARLQYPQGPEPDLKAIEETIRSQVSQGMLPGLMEEMNEQKQSEREFQGVTDALDKLSSGGLSPAQRLDEERRLRQSWEALRNIPTKDNDGHETHYFWPLNIPEDSPPDFDKSQIGKTWGLLEINGNGQIRNARFQEDRAQEQNMDTPAESLSHNGALTSLEMEIRDNFRTGGCSKRNPCFRLHEAIDQSIVLAPDNLKIPQNEKTISPAVGAVDAGVVLDAGYDPQAGNKVLIFHGEDPQTGYLRFSRSIHLGHEPNSGVLVKPGDEVFQHELIGLAGNTGPGGTQEHAHTDYWIVPKGDGNWEEIKKAADYIALVTQKYGGNPTKGAPEFKDWILFSHSLRDMLDQRVYIGMVTASGSNPQTGKSQKATRPLYARRYGYAYQTRIATTWPKELRLQREKEAYERMEKERAKK
ncbi:MAG: peptidoglycan DD-metalloendopeptidase family protein [Elusimicrobia bacterium]|nr:peptidoglycan DD-metalloendopeptidase family protein [Elusimicrobiota bacterium]